MPTLDEFPTLGAVSSQKSTTNTISSVWTTRPDASGRSLNRVSPSANPSVIPFQMPEIKGISSSQRSTADMSKNAISAASPTRLEVSSQTIGAAVVSTERVPPDSNSSAWATNSNTSERSTPVLPLVNSTAIMTSKNRESNGMSSTKTGAAPSSNSLRDPRRIPKGVFVVCDDFLQKNLRRSASIYEKIKACKGCENRSKLKYAVWSDNSKQWEIIRPYPAEKVPPNVAFSECRQYVNNIPCLRTPCSFAHGQQELLMWTLEREGGKFAKLPV